jgi:hypothetical protein
LGIAQNVEGVSDVDRYRTYFFTSNIVTSDCADWHVHHSSLFEPNDEVGDQSHPCQLCCLPGLFSVTGNSSSAAAPTYLYILGPKNSGHHQSNLHRRRLVTMERGEMAALPAAIPNRALRHDLDFAREPIPVRQLNKYGMV